MVTKRGIWVLLQPLRGAGGALKFGYVFSRATEPEYGYRLYVHVNGHMVHIAKQGEWEI